ncbi:unnamed protein product [Protopolystoma xenopodis]|uniref:Elongator complex protein 2 n=1 Tax=Protopolystoma xenopodis TaxID=117903 RepID=A0A448X3A9_9PLAT|nr:unnamed protein product [Protopolystoma xenopodis]
MAFPHKLHHFYHQRLVHHQLTVTQMTFSPSGRYLLAVSRDRTWSLWAAERTTETAWPLFGKLSYCPFKSEMAHSRIIWTCAWSPDDLYFFTGSRDKKLCIWLAPSSEALSNFSTATSDTCPAHRVDCLDCFSQAVTAVSVTNASQTRAYLIAVGLELGGLAITVWSPPDNCTSPMSTLTSGGCNGAGWRRLVYFPTHWSHLATGQVRRLHFLSPTLHLSPTLKEACHDVVRGEQDDRHVDQINPTADGEDGEEIGWLASCADDGLVRVFQFHRSRLVHFIHTG